MESGRRKFDGVLRDLLRNVEIFFSDYKFPYIEFKYVQGTRGHSSHIFLENPLLANRGLEIFGDPRAKSLIMKGDQGPYRDWPMECVNGALVWAVDGIARSAESRLDASLEHVSQSSDRDPKLVQATSMFIVVADHILLDIHSGVWDHRFDGFADSVKFPEFIPYRAEEFWRLDSLGLAEHLLDWQLANWTDVKKKFESMGYGEDFIVTPWEMGEIAGKMMANAAIQDLKKRGVIP